MDNTLSILPSDGASNEFPVLKAFQQYIDAEQAKARKRMLGLSIFFIVLLIVVVITFVLVLTTVINRNQALSDRLLDYALKEREKAPVVVTQPAPVAPAPPQPSAQEILKPFIERLEREQAAMKAAYEKRQKEADAKAAAREAARDAELKKAREELERERARTKKENDRQEAIERHRRRLYPDYYAVPPLPETPKAPQPKATSPSPAPAAKPVASATKPAGSAPAAAAPAAKKPAPPPLSTIKPVTYFNMDDDDGVPFLLETPSKPVQK